MKRLLLATCLLLPAIPAAAGSPDYDMVSLQAEARSELANDMLGATLYVELDDRDPARLAARVSTRMNDAMKLRDGFKGVTFTSGSQSTWPQYGKDNRLDGWRTRASLRIESRDIDAAARAIARLQEIMQLERIGFSVSPASLATAEDRLLGEAIKAFTARAELARAALGAKDWRLVNMNLHTGGYAPPPMPLLRKGLMMAADTAIAPQEMEAGTSTISISVSGTIQLQE